MTLANFLGIHLCPVSKLLVKILKRTGLRMEPCGAPPPVTGHQPVSKFSQISLLDGFTLYFVSNQLAKAQMMRTMYAVEFSGEN